MGGNTGVGGVMDNLKNKTIRFYDTHGGRFVAAEAVLDKKTNLRVAVNGSDVLDALRKLDARIIKHQAAVE